MAELLRMPEVSANAGSAVLMSWSVAESGTFAAADVLAEVETDKAVVDIEAESAGVLLRTLVAAGSEVAVGTPIALLGDPADQDGDLDALLAEMGVRTADLAPAPGAIGTASSVLPDAPDEHARATVGETLADTDTDTDTDTASDSDTLATGDQPTTTGATIGEPPRGDRIFASPLARSLAKQAGLTLAELTGSGPHGRIRRVDVQAALRRRSNGAPATPEVAAEKSGPVSGPVPVPVSRSVAATSARGSSPDRPAWDDEPHSRVRQVIATRLAESKATVPHFYLRAAVPVDRLLTLRREFNGDTGASVSVNDLIVKAVARAHVLVPDMNVIWTPDALRRFRQVDVAVAVASRRGLVTPVVRGVQALSVGAVNREIKELVQRAHDGRLRPDELTGGSITVSNLGMYGVAEFAAIINPPQSAILAVGAAQPAAVVEDGRPAVATVLQLTASVDHRAVDGAVAAQWLSALTTTLQAPLTLLG